MEIVIKNWKTYNPRSDVKKPSWFRMENCVFDSPDFYDFSHADYVSFLYILCMASKKTSGNGRVKINTKHLEKIGRIKSKDFKSAMKKLEENQVITVHVTSTSRPRNAPDTPTNATDGRTDGTNTPKKNFWRDVGLPRVEKVYQEHYPRKEGKAEALTRLPGMIKNPFLLNQFEASVKNYASLVKKEKRERTKIKIFSSFVGTEEKQVWTDYINSQTEERKGIVFT